uniref:Uncharacterized protein n=1 Tax=Taeniopygia guttata TaxID=59729 RepID=A0A674GBV9_TAEGU
ITCIPLPLHTGHFSTAPLFPGFETTTWFFFLPSHLAQITFFCSASFLVMPLYRSSRDTPNWCTTFLLLKFKLMVSFEASCPKAHEQVRYRFGKKVT